MGGEGGPRRLLGPPEDPAQPIAMAPPISRAATARRMPASRPAIIVFRRLTSLEEPFPAQRLPDTPRNSFDLVTGARSPHAVFGPLRPAFPPHSFLSPLPPPHAPNPTSP